MAAAISYKRVLVSASIGSAVLGFALIFGYLLLGHALIEAGFDSNVSFVNQIMQGKPVTPLQYYFTAMDDAVLTLGVYFVLAAVGLLLVTNPLGLVLSGASFLLGTLSIFLILDLFPALVKPLHFDMIPYFNYRLTYMPDPIFGFRERPYNEAQITNFRGFAYSPLYGIDVRPQTLHWRTDAEGFRNPSDSSSADVVVIGSSFTEYGIDVEDTYSARLEKKLHGKKVVNLGKAGYGPFQYLTALEQYGIEKKPKYVIFAFYAPGDIDGYLVDWLKGRANTGVAQRSIAFGGFFPRYRVAIEQMWRMLSSGAWTFLQLRFQRIVGTEFVHPDVAILRLLGNVTKKILFSDRHETRSPHDLLSSPEWREFEKILRTFKGASEQHRFVPVLVYIPVATEIYAEYSTHESGINWQRVRDSYIATSGSNEEAARRLAAKLGIELISLRPAFEQAARQGKLLYYPLDSHWNEEGREIAATATAEALKTLHANRPKASENAEPKPSKNRKPLSGTREVKVESKGSVITRTMDGKISFWNSQAEELYGWTKDEAKGKVSHSLLKTEFPEPLEKIVAELVQTGRWEGKLVHATKDGRRVVVESRWLLDPKGHRGSVVEINTQYADS
jgi:PAS domain S-box-containing protein